MAIGRKKFALDKYQGKFLGVCAGIANFTRIDAFWVRITTVVAAVFFFPIVPIAYGLIGWLASDRRQEKRRSISHVRQTRHWEMDRQIADANYMVSNRHSELSREIDSLR